MDPLIVLFRENIGLLATITLSIGMLSFSHWFLIKKRTELGAEKKLPRQIWLFALTLIAILSIVLALPINDTTRGQILSLVGIVLTAVIALSSTTFVANAMAGLMLRVVNTFSPGDYLRLNDQLCRVTERGLFHTEVQNEDKDLITYPNLFLVTNPTTVISHTGTVITCSLSLGYDTPRSLIEEQLILAAESIGLETPFVLVKKLGDFSVSYKVSGFLNEIKGLVVWRSNLQKAVLDYLHAAKIEIVSPNYMNTRQFDSKSIFLPKKEIHVTPTECTTELVDEKIFDKAEMADEKQSLVEELDKLNLALVSAQNIGNKTKQLEIQRTINQIENKYSEIEACE